MNLLNQLKFRAMRGLFVYANPLFRLMQKIYQKNDDCQFSGESLFNHSNAKETLQQLEANGACKLPDTLTKTKIEEIKSHLSSLKCFDPFNKKIGMFNLEEAPATTHVANYRRQDLIACKSIMDIANDPEILGLAQAYLGACPIIENINCWWSIPSHKSAQQAQNFHRDVDDWKFIKLFIYLTDVDLDSGPHVYVKKSVHAKKLLKIRRYQDHEVTQHFPASDIEYFTGAAGATFLVDTLGIHKGLLPKSERRLLLQVQYGINKIYLENYKPEKSNNPQYNKTVNQFMLDLG